MATLNQIELRFFARMQGSCLFFASLLLMVSHFFIYSTACYSADICYVFAFTVFLAIYLATFVLDNRLKTSSMKCIIALYSILSLAMLIIFLY